MRAVLASQLQQIHGRPSQRSYVVGPRPSTPRAREAVQRRQLERQCQADVGNGRQLEYMSNGMASCGCCCGNLSAQRPTDGLEERLLEAEERLKEIMGNARFLEQLSELLQCSVGYAGPGPAWSPKVQFAASPPSDPRPLQKRSGQQASGRANLKSEPRQRPKAWGEEEHVERCAEETETGEEEAAEDSGLSRRLQSLEVRLRGCEEARQTTAELIPKMADLELRLMQANSRCSVDSKAHADQCFQTIRDEVFPRLLTLETAREVAEMKLEVLGRTNTTFTEELLSLHGRIEEEFSELRQHFCRAEACPSQESPVERCKAKARDGLERAAESGEMLGWLNEIDGPYGKLLGEAEAVGPSVDRAVAAVEQRIQQVESTLAKCTAELDQLQQLGPAKQDRMLTAEQGLEAVALEVRELGRTTLHLLSDLQVHEARTDARLGTVEANQELQLRAAHGTRVLSAPSEVPQP
mmetsp:Transcript_52320/g.94158  ORF Transcript_52320/g.94158 Transcript_52320/m.94158 type:complete len:467 (-) Transcript_52320:39-1439(-)